MSSYVIELDFEKDPSRLLEELGLGTKQFQKVKENILTRLAGRPEIQMIVLEFQPSGLYYGEVRFGQQDDYRKARRERSEIIGQSTRRDQGGLEEPAAGGDDGISDREASGEWSLEQLLRSSAETIRS